MRIKNSAGFTLAEVTITLGVTLLVGTLLLVVIVNSAGLFYKESSKVGQGVGINDALSKMTEEIKASSAIAVSYTDGSTTYTSTSNQLVLKLSSIDSSGNILSATDYFVFFLDQKKLRFKTFPDPTSARKAADQIFSTNTNSLVFQYFNSSNQEVISSSATKVKITLKLKQKAGATDEQNIATSEANLRND